jgi:G3E family GTPase
LVERLDGEAVLLNAGCLCCTVRGDLVRALDRLWDRVMAGQEVRRVVVETTGLADPAPILQTLMADPALARRFVLDGVVTLVDAVNGAATLDGQEEAVRQAAVADRLVLSKTDLAPADAIAALTERLRALNPVAPILAGDTAEPAGLLAAGPYDPSVKSPDVARWIGAPHHRHHHRHDPNRHDSRIRALCLEFETPLPWDGLATWLEMLSLTRGASILRIKGILDLQGQDRPVAVHGVQGLFHPPVRLETWPAGEARRSRLVLILRDLDPGALRDSLHAFLRAAEERDASAA